MPGFALAKKAIEVFERAKPSDGLILSKHGIFTFGDTAREAYERMIEMVTLAEEFIARNRKAVAVAAHAAEHRRRCRRSRRSCAAPAARRTRRRRRLAPARPRIPRRRDRAAISSMPSRIWRASAKAAWSRPTTPSAPRTGRWFCRRRKTASSTTSRAPRASGPANSPTRYQDYFARHNKRVGGIKHELDPLPRVVLVPGLGLFGLGRSKQDAIIAADIAEAWIEGVTDAEAIGRFESISEADMFDCEYWSLEQAKLGTRKEMPLAGQVAAITGAGGAIGAATARAFAAAGAEVALLDVDCAAAREQAERDRRRRRCRSHAT